MRPPVDVGGGRLAAPPLPRIVKVLSAVALLYGAWLLEPRWIYGIVGLLVLYALLTNVPRFTALLDSANGGLSTLFRPAGH